MASKGRASPSSGLGRIVQTIVRLAVDAAVRAVHAELDRMFSQGERSIQIGVVNAVHTEDGQTWADVTCQPTGLELTCRVASPIPGLARRVRDGDEVVVALPRGKLWGAGVIVAQVHNTNTPGPEGMDSDHTVLAADEELLLSAKGVRIKAPEIAIGNGGSGQAAARSGDPIVLSEHMKAWLQAVASAAGYAEPIPTDGDGTIEQGSAITTIE